MTTDKEPISIIKLGLKDWGGIFAVLVIQASVIVGSWWALSDRVLVLEIIQKNQETFLNKLINNQAKLVETGLRQQHIISRLNNLEDEK